MRLTAIVALIVLGLAGTLRARPIEELVEGRAGVVLKIGGRSVIPMCDNASGQFVSGRFDFEHYIGVDGNLLILRSGANTELILTETGEGNSSRYYRLGPGPFLNEGLSDGLLSFQAAHNSPLLVAGVLLEERSDALASTRTTIDDWLADGVIVAQSDHGDGMPSKITQVTTDLLPGSLMIDRVWPVSGRISPSVAANLKGRVSESSINLESESQLFEPNSTATIRCHIQSHATRIDVFPARSLASIADEEIARLGLRPWHLSAQHEQATEIVATAEARSGKLFGLWLLGIGALITVLSLVLVIRRTAASS